MEMRRLATAMGALLYGLLACQPHAGAAEKPEELTVAKVPPYSPHRVFVTDVSFASMTDARVHVFDGDTKRFLGEIDAGFAPGFTISPTTRRAMSRRRISRAAAMAYAPM